MNELLRTLPPEAAELGDDEVHVWSASLELPSLTLQDLDRTLSSDERERAARYHFPIHRARYVAARGILRTILGNYRGVEPGQLRFHYNDYGKPQLEGDLAEDNLCFNMSHTEGLCLVAVTRGRAIGIDVEHLRADVDVCGVAGRVFSKWESAVLATLPERERIPAFFNGWTRKEAFVKAVGLGLSFPVDRISVSITPGKPAALLDVAVDGYCAEDWALQALHPGPDYVAALAVAGHGWRLSCRGIGM